MTSDLVVFGEDWGGLPSSTQHLFTHLGLGRKVLWVNSIGLRKPRLTIADCKRAWKKLRLQRSPDRSKLSYPSPNFTVVNPRTIPAPSNHLERGLATRLLQNQLVPAIQKAKLQDPILWLSLPTASDMVGKLGTRSTVYYCGDDFSALAGVDHATVSARERELHDKADLIITASQQLARQFPDEKTRLLTHGVDFQLFSTPSTRARDLPADGKPIAGFYGSISEWLDLELLVATIKRMPHWNFVLIGNAVVDISALQKLENVYLTGPKAHHELPGYSQHWNTSLLPFKDNAQIRACNPLKLSEYLATGKPVVSTPFPALQPYRALVSVAGSVDSMVEAIENSLHLGQVSAFPRVLSATVSDKSWQAKAQLVDRWLRSL